MSRKIESKVSLKITFSKNEIIIPEANKCDFEYRKYILPVVKDAKFQKICEVEDKYIYPHIVLEAFKNQEVPIQPSICTYTFMLETEIKNVKEEKDTEKLMNILEQKLKKVPAKGTPKNILIDLFMSIVKFSNKYNYDIPQTGAILSMFYNTHLYLSYNLFATPEDIYNVFKEYIYCHSVSVPPYKTKIFEPKEANQIMMYFCSIYLRNLTLIRYLMFPNYGLDLKIKNPVPPEEKKGKKGKKDKKEKKGKKGKGKKGKKK